MIIYNDDKIDLKELLNIRLTNLLENKSQWTDINVEIISYNNPTLVQIDTDNFSIVGKGVNHTTLHYDTNNGTYNSLKKISINKIHAEITPDDIKTKVLEVYPPLYQGGFIKVKINNNLIMKEIRYNEYKDILINLDNVLLEGLISKTLKQDIIDYANSKGVLLEITPYNRRISKISREEFELKYYKYIIHPHDVYSYKQSLYEIKKQIDLLLDQPITISYNNSIKPNEISIENRIDKIVEVLTNKSLSEKKENVWTM